MRRDQSEDVHPFDVIDSGAGLAPDLARPVAAPAPRPGPGSDARAADLAALYALALLRQIPCADLRRPDRAVTVRGAPPLTVAGLVSELARQAAPGDIAGGDRGFDGLGAARPDGLPEVLSRITGGPRHRISALWGAGTPGFVAANPGGLSRPEVAAPMSVWLRWCATRHGAALAMPGRSADHSPATLGSLGLRVASAGPVQPFLVAALALLSGGATLRVASPQALLELLDDLAGRAGARSHPAPPASPRPGVMAGRLALLRAGEPQSTMPDGAEAAAILATLDRTAPRLLLRIARLNDLLPGGAVAARRDHEPCYGWTPLPLRDNLALPPLVVHGRRIDPGRARTCAQTAAALSAALRLALAVTSQQAAEIDCLVHDIALGAATLGGLWPAEIRAEIQRGRATGRSAALAALGTAGAQRGGQTLGPDLLPPVLRVV